MNLLIGLAMGLSLLALASNRLPSVIRAAAFQGMILGTLPLLIEAKISVACRRRRRRHGRGERVHHSQPAATGVARGEH